MDMERNYCTYNVRHTIIDVKNAFLFWSRLLRFSMVFIFQTFLFKKNVGKVQSGKQINKKHFQNNTNEIDL